MNFEYVVCPIVDYISYFIVINDNSISWEIFKKNRRFLGPFFAIFGLFGLFGLVL